MSLPLHILTTEALALDREDRLRLVSEILQSVEGPPDERWNAEWSGEIDHRLKEAEKREKSGEARGEDWQSIKKRALEQLKS